MSDFNSQEKAVAQSIKIYAPQKNNPDGYHLFEMQENETSGYLRLRAGGDYVVESVRNTFVLSRKSTVNFSENKRLDFTNEEHYIRSNKVLAMQSNGPIYLLAGQDYTVFRQPQVNIVDTGNNQIDQIIDQSVKTNIEEKGPGIAPVIVFQNGCLKVSDRVYASCSQYAQGVSLGSLIMPEGLGIGGESWITDVVPDGKGGVRLVQRQVPLDKLKITGLPPAGCR